jgi:hypothetical protein
MRARCLLSRLTISGLVIATMMTPGVAVANGDSGATVYGQPDVSPQPEGGTVKRPVEEPLPMSGLHVPEGGSSAPSAPEGASVGFSGRVVTEAGRPARNVRVRLDLQPSAKERRDVAHGVGLASLNLGQTRTNERGAFAFTVGDIRDRSGYVEPDGTVNLLVSSIGDGVTVLQRISAKPEVNDGATVFVWETEDERIADDYGQARSATAHGRKGLPVKVKLRSTRDEPVSAEPQGDVGTAGTDGGVRGSDYCPGTFTWVRDDQSNITHTWDRLQRIYIKGGLSLWRYQWSTSSETQQDTVANVGSGGALVTAGYSKIASSAGGATWEYRSQSVQMDARAQYDNRVNYLYCLINGTWQYRNVYEWQPYVWTAYVGVGTLNTPIFNCESRYTIPLSGTEIWVSRDATLQFSVGTTLVGVNARTSQKHTTSHKLTLNGYSQICGYLAYPSTASQIREV